MYIHRVVLRGLKASPDRDITFWDEWMQAPLRSILITGPNGSGKTTMLRVIAALWENLEIWLQSRQPNPQPSFLSEVEFAGLEIRDWHPSGSIWIYIEKDFDAGNRFFNTLSVEPTLKIGQTIYIQDLMIPQLGIEGAKAWFDTLVTHYTHIQLGQPGVIFDLPNMVYLDADDRKVLAPPDEPRSRISPEPLYRWLATYIPTNNWEGHLETMLGNLKLRDPEWFHKTIDQINKFFTNKKLSDFDNHLRLPIQIGKPEDSQTHYLENLSSGEQQIALMIFMVSRWQMPGGIVLIDEPDLHLHVSLQRHFIHELEKLVISKNGQLIVTSHSPQLWEEYDHRERVTFDLEVAQ